MPPPPGIGAVLPYHSPIYTYFGRCRNCSFSIRCDTHREPEADFIAEEQRAAMLAELRKPDVSTVLRMHALHRGCSQAELEFSDAATGELITEFRTSELVPTSHTRVEPILDLINRSDERPH